MRKLVSLAVWAAAACALFTLAGCNTIEGMGKDIKTGGEKIEEAAKKK